MKTVSGHIADLLFAVTLIIAITFTVAGIVGDISLLYGLAMWILPILAYLQVVREKKEHVTDNKRREDN